MDQIYEVYWGVEPDHEICWYARDEDEAREVMDLHDCDGYRLLSPEESDKVRQMSDSILAEHMLPY